MKTWLKKLYKIIDSKHPDIGCLIYKLYYRQAFNKTRRVICGRNNVVRYYKSTLTSVVFNIKGDRNTIEIADGCRLHNVTFYIRGNDHQVLIGRDCCFNLGGTIWLEDSSCSLTIGKDSTFEEVLLTLTEPGSKIFIGQGCMFASDIDVRTGDSHAVISRASGKRLNDAEDVTIGNHVWIAAHSVLLKGSLVSDDSVVATGSVVTRKFGEKGIIIGGNPAVQLKEGITWTRER